MKYFQNLHPAFQLSKCTTLNSKYTNFKQNIPILNKAMNEQTKQSTRVTMKQVYREIHTDTIHLSILCTRREHSYKTHTHGLFYL